MSIMLFEPPGCVFIRIRKAGSTSFVRGLFGGRDNAALISSNGEWHSAFDGRFVFTIVRNPFDRLGSALRMFSKYRVTSDSEDELRSRLSLDLLMDLVEDDSIDPSLGSYVSKARLHSLPMTHPLFHIRRAQFIGRFENFEQDFRLVADRLGLPVDRVPHERQRPALDYRQMFSAAERSRAERVFATDLERFGYDFG